MRRELLARCIKTVQGNHELIFDYLKGISYTAAQVWVFIAHSRIYNVKVEMSTDLLVEIFGYIASAIVVASFALTSVRKLRIVNAIGAILSVIYAVIIGSYPVVLMNLVVACLDIYQLYKLSHVRISFELVPANPTSDYFNWFCKRHEADLAFDTEERYKKSEKVFFYVRDNEVAGLLAYNLLGEGRADIVMDYVTEKFRDCKIGRYFFGKENTYFTNLGITEFITHTTSPKHESYLRQLHFTPGSNGEWRKSCQ